MSGKSQAPDKGQQEATAKVMVERGDAKATTGKIAEARNGVTDKAVTDKMDARDVTNAALRDARCAWLSGLPQRHIAAEKE